MADNAISILINAKDNASNTLRQVSGDIRTLGDRTEEATGKTSRFGAASLKMGAAVGATAAVVSNIASRAFQDLSSVVGDAVARVDTLNNFPRIMANFGVSAQDATQMIRDLDAGVRGLPTTLNDIAQLAEGFVPLTKNTKVATDTALALNDAILAGGAPAQVQAAALEQFRQALSKGVPDLQDWKTLEMAMPAQLQQVNDKLGIGTGVLKDYANNGLGLYQAMKDGKLSMDQFNAALVSLNTQGINGLPNFATQAKNATQGISTGFTNAKTAVTRGVADIMQAIGSQNISKALSGFGKGFEDALKSVAQAMPQIVAYIQPIAHWVGEMLTPSLSALANTISERLAPAVQRLLPFLEKYEGTLGVILVAAVWALINVLTILVSTLSYVYQVVANVGDFFVRVWRDQIVGTWNAAGDFFKRIANDISSKFDDVRKSISDAFDEIPNRIAGIRQSAVQIVNAFTSAFDRLKQIVGNLPNDFVQWGKNAANGYITGLKTLADYDIGSILSWKSQVQNIYNQAVALGKQVGKGILDGLNSAKDFIVQFVPQALQAMWSAAQASYHFVIDVGKGIIRSIKDGLTQGFADLVQAGKNIISSIVSGLNNGVGAITGFFTGLPGRISDALHRAGTDIGDQTQQGVKSSFSSVDKLKQIGNTILKGIAIAIAAVIGGIVLVAISIGIAIINGILTGIRDALGAIPGVLRSVKGTITGAFAGAGGWLVDAGRAIMNGLRNGLVSAFDSVKSFVSGIGGWIKDHKGPISYDKQLLIPAGAALMDGLNEGLNKSFNDVKSNVGAMAGQIANTIGGTYSGPRLATSGGTVASGSSGPSHRSFANTTNIYITGPVSMNTEQDLDSLATRIDKVQRLAAVGMA